MPVSKRGSEPLLGEVRVDSGGSTLSSPTPSRPGSVLGRQSALRSLHSLKKTPEEVERLLASTPTVTQRRRRDLASFYARQNELIDSLIATEEIHRGEFTNDAAAEGAQVRRAVNLSFAANCALLAVRVALAVISRSLSLVVATLDAVLDVVSSAIMFFTSWQAKRKNKYLWPVGQERMEPLGVIVFATIMGTAAVSVIAEGIRALLEGGQEGMPNEGLVVGGTLGVVAMKLLLFLYCRGSPSPAVAAFALDHLNDVLVNGVGLAGALLGARIGWYWDPIVAIALSLWVVWAWGSQAKQHIVNLVGRAAPPDLLQRMTFLAFYHDARVLYIDTVRAFTLGSQYIAEVDIVLPEDMPLREAHDIGEALQIKLELLPEVSRAYVHIDWETTHRPEH